jgi:uncharacterized protein YciI
VKTMCVMLAMALATASSSLVSQTKPAAALDTALIRTLKADELGMKKYVMAFLKAGPNRNQDSATAAKLQAAHLANIRRMADAGKLVIAGPFLDENDIRGIYIFNVESVEEARALTSTDPAVKAGRLVMELHPWYGSAALQKVTEIHSKIQAKTF